MTVPCSEKEREEGAVTLPCCSLYLGRAGWGVRSIRPRNQEEEASPSCLMCLVGSESRVLKQSRGYTTQRPPITEMQEGEYRRRKRNSVDVSTPGALEPPMEMNPIGVPSE